jgi:ion channel POLLUX/CASTOR
VASREGGRGRIAVLANKDKVEMEDEIRARVRHTGRVRVICRTGSTTDPTDLEIVRPDESNSIIVLAPAGADSDADIHVIKSLLALRNRVWPKGQPPVIAAVSDSHNLPAARLAGGPAVQIVDAKDIIARLVVQSRRQPGLSAVWTELLGFEGEEIYMTAEPKLVGRCYGDAMLAYEASAVFGVRRAGTDAVVVNPSMDTTIAAGDELVVVAKTQNAVRLASRPLTIVQEAISVTPEVRPVADRTLILGWNAYGPTILNLLDRYLPDHSQVTIATPRPAAEIRPSLSGLTKLSADVATCNTTERPALEGLDPRQYQHVLVLAEDGMDATHADSRTLVTLLHLRDMKEQRGDGYAIVSELNDDANRRLAQVTQADDFIIGKKLITLYLAQLSQNPHLSSVFAELFDAQGSDIYLRPAAEFVRPGAPATFGTVVAAARRRHETAIGYRRQAEAYRSPSYGVVLNPAKSQPLTLLAEDRVVVLARV